MSAHSLLLSFPLSSQKAKRRAVHMHIDTYNKKLKVSRNMIHIRELTLNEAGLGCSIWDGSILLARWSLMHTSLFDCKIGMELGCGIAIPSLAVGRVASKVYASDYMESIMDNLTYNVKLNSNIPDTMDEEDYDLLSALGEDAMSSELSVRNQQRKNLGNAVQPILLDFHAIDPDDEDLRRLEVDGAKCEVGKYDALQERLSFIPSPYFIDPLSEGCESMDFILGSELIYTTNLHHHICFYKVLQYYLRPGGFYYCVQSANREGMPDFCQFLLTKQWNIHHQLIKADAGIVGLYGSGKNFVQREEQYILYIIQKPYTDGREFDEVTHLSLPNSSLHNLKDVPLPTVQMLRDGEKVKEGIEEVVKKIAAASV